MPRKAAPKKKGTPNVKPKRVASTKSVAKPASPKKARPSVPALKSKGHSAIPRQPAPALLPRDETPEWKGAAIATYAPAEAGVRQRDAARKYQQKSRDAARDIAPLPIAGVPIPSGPGIDEGATYEGINWDRRLSCKFDLKLFNKTYLASTFFWPWSKDHLYALARLQECILHGGKHALAMPRGGAKTTNVRGASEWGVLYGHKHFVYNIASSYDKSLATLEFIKTYFATSPLFLQDFPELCYPCAKLGNRWHGASGQTYNGQTTFIEWATDTLRLPALILPKEIAEQGGYLTHDPDCLRWIDKHAGYISKAGGSIIKATGIDGSIRGESLIHPITLGTMRPDLVILDDVQKDSKSESLVTCEKLIRLIDGAVLGLAGPGQQIAVFMPCTVEREGDVSDTYLDHAKKPDWNGQRCPMVVSWPEGITDDDISIDTPAGRLWNKYLVIYRDSMRIHQDIRLATEFYGENREAMDLEFVCSWEQRYTGSPIVREGIEEPLPPKEKCELSAQQHAMNLRIQSPTTFPAEYQQRGRKPDGLGTMLISADELVHKVVPGLPEFSVPADTKYIVAYIDVQNEILFYSFVACNEEMTGVVPAYGTYPDVQRDYFRKQETEAWSFLSKRFFQVNPNEPRSHNTKKHLRADLEAKIYNALFEAVPYLKNMEFIRQDGHNTVMKVQHIGIDSRWGMVSEVIKRFCRESGHAEVMPCHGQYIPPARTQYEMMQKIPTTLFEDQRVPVKEAKWMWFQDKAGQYQFQMDVDRLKTFLFQRLAAPQGSRGSIALFNAAPHRHQMFADHLCKSEYPEIPDHEIVKEHWLEHEGKPDNDWLDCMVACMALLSFAGAYVRTDGQITLTKKRKLSEIWRKKHQRG